MILTLSPDNWVCVDRGDCARLSVLRIDLHSELGCALADAWIGNEGRIAIIQNAEEVEVRPDARGYLVGLAALAEHQAEAQKFEVREKWIGDQLILLAQLANIDPRFQRHELWSRVGVAKQGLADLRRRARTVAEVEEIVEMARWLEAPSGNCQSFRKSSLFQTVARRPVNCLQTKQQVDYFKMPPSANAFRAVTLHYELGSIER
jgi:hypothetical protein